MNASQIVSHLNAIRVGDLAAIRTKLAEARAALAGLEQPELAEKLVEAEQALARADLRTYRKRLETVVSRLGHLQ